MRAGLDKLRSIITETTSVSPRLTMASMKTTIGHVSDDDDDDDGGDDEDDEDDDDDDDRAALIPFESTKKPLNTKSEKMSPVRFQTLHRKKMISTGDAVGLVLLTLKVDGTGGLGQAVRMQFFAAAPADLDLIANNALAHEPRTQPNGS